jgi:putative ABC transport system permease protein
MRWLYKLPLRFRSLFRREDADRELSEELEFHLQKQIEQYVEDGMAPQEARQAALRSFGGLQQVNEECRQAREVSLLEDLLQDLRFAARTVAKNPAFAVVIVVTLALGIGANTAIFSLVNALLLQPPPYPEPERLVGVWDMTSPKGGVLENQQRLQTIDMGAYTADTGFNLSGHGEALRLNGSAITSNLMPMLGVRPKLGRWFKTGDEVPGQSRLAILSYTTWQTKFGGDPGIIGRTITLDDTAREVVGVMPADFRFPTPATELWIPVEINTADHNSIWGPFLYVMIGRMRPGADLARVQAEFRTVLPQVVKSYPWPMGDKYGSLAEIVPLREHAVVDVQTTLLLLLGAVFLVLMVACANVANLLLARSAVRQREIAIRTALGASRRRILRQLLTESVFLSLLGGALGCLLAFLTLAILKAILPATPGLAEVAIDAGSTRVALDARVLGFSSLLSILTGLIFGLAPAWQTSKAEIEPALQANAQSSGKTRKSRRLSSSLVVGEIALAVILVSGAGLLIKSLWLLGQINPGFRPDHLLTARLTPTVEFCKTKNACIDYYRELLARLRALPGVKDAAVADSVPLTGLPSVPLAVEDRPDLSTDSPYQAWEFQVSPDYLSTMDIPLLRGRNFTEFDNQKSPGVVLVSKALGQVLWPGQDPIGKRLKPSWQPQWRTVVGVVDEVTKYKSLPGKRWTDWAGSLKGDIYFPEAQGIVVPPMHLAVAVRAARSMDAETLGKQFVSTVAAVNPSVPVSEMRTMNEVVSNSVSSSRSIMWLFVTFAGLALLLGAIGIYSLMSYSVAQRTREIGIRMAMGADRSDVLRMVLRQGSLLAAAGVALGAVSAFFLTRLMTSLLYGVRPNDPATFVLVSLTVIAAATVATYVPSNRATKVDPTVALKCE